MYTHLNRILPAALFCVCLLPLGASAQITESDWNSSLTGSQDWQIDGNWSTATFPNDPGRVDPDMTVFTPVIGANLSVGLGADLDLNVGATDVTVASLRLGSTAGPITTTISGSGGRLVFENFELNDTTDPENVIPAFNSSRALIVSGGPAGSVNQITAPLHLNDSTDVGTFMDGPNVFESTNDLTVSGQVTFGGNGSLNAVGPVTVNVTGSVLTQAAPTTEDPEATTTARFNADGEAQGTVHVTGVVSGPGHLHVGGNGGTTILSAANTIGSFSFGRGTLVLDNDQAIGTDASIIDGGPAGIIVSTDDARTVSTRMRLSGYATVAGDHSLTWLGDITQSNSRGWINNIAAGKTFTVAGKIAADDDPPEPTPNERELYFDGNGEWIIAGEMVNRLDSDEFPLPDNDQPQSFGQRGTGTVRVTGTNNTYSAFTRIEGGNWHFASNASLPTAVVQSISGTIGVDTGTIFQGGNPGSVNSTFLSKLNNRSQGIFHGRPDVESFFDYDSGGLMLTPAEAGLDIDFTSGDIARAQDMSLSGDANGITYTGTVTPANSTYRFGGGTGVITLPNANQLTGGNDLLVSNGLDSGDVTGLGGVKITGVNNYTGVTEIRGQYLQSRTTNGGGVGMARDAYNGTTLTVTDLANGGVSSSIGASSSDASNLILQGSTLRYEGDGDTTDRLFTIGTHGGSLDSSGSGALVFSNTAALNVASAEDRIGILSGFAFGHKVGITQSSEHVAFDFDDTSDLVRGMVVTEDGGFLQDSDGSGSTTIGIQSPTRISLSDQQNLFVNGAEIPSTFSFIDVERTFTLTGDNTDDNTLSSAIGDSMTNILHLAKEGAGKWILNGANSYTGDTTVTAGTLGVMDGVGTLAGGTDFNLGADGALEIEIGGASSNDLFTFTGEATLSGDITISLIDGFNPTSGTFDILTAASIIDDGLTLSGDGNFSFAIVDGTTLQLIAEGGGGLLGDSNGDGVVNTLDIDAFVLALTNPAQYAIDFPGVDFIANNDIDMDGSVNTLDIDPFVALLTGPASFGAAPEPSAVTLIIAGLAAGAWRRRRSNAAA